MLMNALETRTSLPNSLLRFRICPLEQQELKGVDNLVSLGMRLDNSRFAAPRECCDSPERTKHIGSCQQAATLAERLDDDVGFGKEISV